MSRRSLGTLTIDVLAEVGGFASGLDKSERRTEKWRKKVEKEAKLAGVALGSALAVGIALVIKNSVAAEQEIAQLDAIIKSTGGAAGYTRQQLLDMADALSAKSTFSGGEIVEAQTRLLSYSGVLGENIPRAMQAIIDQSARLGISVSQSAETIGRALESPAKAAAALAQSGFGAAFTKEVRGTIDALVKAGREGEAQVMILEILEESYAGAAQAARDTFAGALKALGNTLDDLTTGKDGSLQGTTGAVNDLIEALNDPGMREGISVMVEGLLSITATAAESIAMIGGLWNILAQARLSVDQKSYQGLLQEQMRLQESITKDEAGEIPSFGLSKEDNAKLLQDKRDRLKEVEKALEYQRLMERAASVTIIEDGQALPSSAFKDGNRPRPSGVSDKEEAATKKRLALQERLRSAYESTSLQYQRDIALFDTSSDKSEKATTLQRLNFELAEGALKGLNAQEQIRLRTLAIELDRLADVREANDKNAKALADFHALQKELNKADSHGLELARERLRIIQAGKAAGASDDDYLAAAGQAIDAMSGPADYAGPDALFGGGSGELRKIDRAVEEESKRYAAQLTALEEYRQARADLEADWDEKEAKIRADHEGRVAAMDADRNQVRLTMAQEGMGHLTDIMRASFGEQSDMYRAAFAVEKAFAIASAIISIQGGIADAAKNPWPLNLAAMASVAAATAGIVSNIQAVGMAHDGIDAVPETGTWLLQKGERVTTAATSAKLDATLERVGRDTDGSDKQRPYSPTIQINGNPDDRTIALVEAAVARGGQQFYDRVATDLATGTGKVSRGQRAGFNVNRRLR
ncbi:Prophage tail length tape measure protein [compost metagenome]